MLDVALYDATHVPVQGDDTLTFLPVLQWRPRLRERSERRPGRRASASLPIGSNPGCGIRLLHDSDLPDSVAFRRFDAWNCRVISSGSRTRLDFVTQAALDRVDALTPADEDPDRVHLGRLADHGEVLPAPDPVLVEVPGDRVVQVSDPSGSPPHENPDPRPVGVDCRLSTVPGRVRERICVRDRILVNFPFSLQ